MKPTPTLQSSPVYILATAVVIAAMGLVICGGRAAAAGSDVEAVSPHASIDASAFLSADRSTTWSRGMMGGRHPHQSGLSTLSPRGRTG